ncbi:MAG TPA: hypothetical protein VKZ48_05465 [Burkholderiales bacterium]|nr:hypothetical protein [Burkholderiales bacterium]
MATIDFAERSEAKSNQGGWSLATMIFCRRQKITQVSNPTPIDFAERSEAKSNQGG